MIKLLSTCVEWSENAVQVEKFLPFDQKQKVIVTHDKSVFNANDGRHQLWVKKKSQPLRQKSRGKGIMVSDFLTPIGRLQDPSTGEYATAYLE